MAAGLNMQKIVVPAVEDVGVDESSGEAADRWLCVHPGEKPFILFQGGAPSYS